MHQKINSASFLIAITAAIACATFACESAMAAAGGVNNVPNLPAPSGAAIYKMVDASGRVTYTNSPTKGANKVELDPITVIPATPAGMLGDGQSVRQNTAKGATQSATQGVTQGAAQNASQPTPSAPFAAVAQFATSPLLIPVGVAPTIARPEEPSPMPAVVKTLPAQPVARLVVPANVLSAAAVAPDIRFSPPTPAKPMATAVVTAIPANTASTSATKLPVVKLVSTSVAAAKVEVAANVAALPATPLVAFAPTAPTFAATPAAAATINTSAISGLPVPQLRPSASPARVISTNQAARINQQEQLLATARAQLVEEQRASESFRALRARLPAVIDQTNPAKAAIQNDIKTQVEQHFERIRNLQDQISQYEHNQAALQPISQMRAHSSNAASAAVNTVASQ
jgi:hypothetical protein